MKKILCAVLAIFVAAVGFHIPQFDVQAAEDTRYIVYEQDMENQTIEEIVSTFSGTQLAQFTLEDDTSVPGNKAVAVKGSTRFEIRPERACTGTEITLEYRFKFKGNPKNFELMRAFADSGTGVPMIYNDYNNAFTCRVGKGSPPSLGKRAAADTWYRYVIILRNLPSENPEDKVFDHIIYERQPDGSEKEIVNVKNLPIMRWDNPAATQFHRFWIQTLNADNLLFDDFMIYSNNEADVVEEYKVRNDRRQLSASDLSSEPSDQITSDLTLPSKGELFGSSITWTSSDPEIIDPATGKITRPADTTDVTLTADLSLFGVDKDITKDFTFTVMRDDRPDEEVVADRAEKLDLEGKNQIISDFPLPESAGYYTTVTWSVDPNPVIKVDGYGAIVTRPETDTKVTLHAVVSRGEAESPKDIEVTVLKKDVEEEVCYPYETFEQYSDHETELRNWTLNNGNGSIEKITTDDGIAALKVEKPSGTGSTSAVLDFSQQADNTVFDIRMKATAENTTLLSLSQEDSAKISFANEGGSLVVDVCGTKRDLGQFPNGEWFTVRAELDHDARLVDIYVNGARKASDISAGEQTLAINKISTEITGSATGEIYIDFIKGHGDFYRDLNLTIEQIDFGDLARNSITDDFNLPMTGVGQTKLVWTSDTPSVIEIVEGVAKVTRPDYDEEDALVTLTLEVSNSYAAKEATYMFRVLKNMSDEEIIALDLPSVTVPTEISTSGIQQIVLPTSGKNGSVMKWQSSNPNVIGTDGRVYSIGYDGNAVEEVTLTLTISHGTVSQTKEFEVRVYKTNYAYDSYVVASSSESGHSAPNAVDNKPDTYWLSQADETKPNLHISLKNVSTFNQLVLTAYGESTIKAKVEYSTNDVDWYPLCNVSNLNDQPNLYVFEPVQAKYLRYTVTDKTLEAAGLYEFEVYHDETPGNLLEKAVAAVSIHNANNIKEDFELPLTGLYNVTFEWTSEDESIIKIENGKALVTRPKYDTDVTLTLLASLSDETMTATRTVTVKGTGSSGGNGGNSGSGGSSGSGGGGGNRGNSGSAGVINLPTETKPATPQKLYTDVDDTHWAKQYIETVSEEGIMNGRGNQIFEPDANITREEFVKVLLIAFGFELKDDAGVEFADVDKNAWYYPYVATAKNLGIINGISETAFGISSAITREDMAVMVVRAASLKGKTYDATVSEITFADQDTIADYAKESVQILTKAAILSGMGDNTFAPQRPATRAEVAKIICLLDK